MEEGTNRVVTTSFAYCCLDGETARRRPLTGVDLGAPKRPLFGSLEAARTACAEGIVVIDTDAVEDAGYPELDFAPAEALLNVDPYLEPGPVTAAGGLVTRLRDGGLELLLIHRRGVWDLPKGKLVGGESVRMCARREVCEELGISDLNVGRSLGMTVHGYRDGRTFAVKTTHWFQMTTSEEKFSPQVEEEISAAEWFRWARARQMLGFETLRRHTARIEPLLAAIGDP